MSANGVKKINREGVTNENARKQTGIKIDMIENKNTSNKMSGPIVIPSSVRNAKNKGPAAVRPMGNNIEIPKTEQQERVIKKVVKRTSETATGADAQAAQSKITIPSKILEKKANETVSKKTVQPEITQTKKVAKSEEQVQKVKKVKKSKANKPCIARTFEKVESK